MHQVLHIRASVLAIPLALTLLSGCASPPRLQTLGEAMNEMSRSNQAKQESKCGADGQASIECKRKLRAEFEQLRKRNDTAARD